MRWLWVHAGLSDPGGPWYLWWSGIGSILVVWVASVALLWWHRSCRAEWYCLFIGRHDFADEKGVTHRLCWRHHPDLHGKNLTKARIAEIQRRHHLYLGSQPGRDQPPVEYR